MQGAQTLSRGLTVLSTVAQSDGLTIQEVADALAVHRTVASRLLTTLQQHNLIYRDEKRLYRPSAGLAALGNSFDRGLRLRCLPILQRVAEELRASVALLVAEGGEAVAVAVIVPPAVSYVLAFREGSRHPIDRGAAGIALLAGQAPHHGERPEVTQARQQGWARSYGEVEPNTYALAVPVARREDQPSTCINLITHREDVLNRSREAMVAAAGRLAIALASTGQAVPSSHMDV